MSQPVHEPETRHPWEDDLDDPRHDDYEPPTPPPPSDEPELAQPDFQTRPVEPPYRSIDYGWPFTGSPVRPPPSSACLPPWTGHLGHSRACDDHQNLG
jgi:hypothetical protein